MTSPQVTELPRPLEPVSRDTFLADGEAPLARVVALRAHAVTGFSGAQPQPRAA
jgi:hypothetical protein